MGYREREREDSDQRKDLNFLLFEDLLFLLFNQTKMRRYIWLPRDYCQDFGRLQHHEGVLLLFYLIVRPSKVEK